MLEGAGRVLNLSLSFAGARFLGPAAWGGYWAAFGTAQWLGLATDFGGHLTLAGDIARTPRQAVRAFSTSFRLKGALVVAVLGVLLFLAPRLPFSPTVLWPLIGGLLALSWLEWLGYVVRGHGMVVAESGLLGMDCALAFGCGLAALSLGAGVAGFAVSQLMAHAVALLLGWAYVRRVLPSPSTPGPVVPFLSRAFPTGLAILLSIGSWRLGMLMLAWTGGEGAGFYAVAHRLLEAARLIPALAAAALFPSFARTRPGHTPWQPLAVLVPGAILGCLVLSAPGLAGWLLVTLFGSAYAAGAPVVTRIIWALPFMTTNAILTHWLVARGRVRTNAALSGLHLAIHAAGLVWLLPTLGPVGAAWSLVGAEAALTAGTLAAVLAV